MQPALPLPPNSPEEDMHLCLVARDSGEPPQDTDRLWALTNILEPAVPAYLRDPTTPQQAIAQAVAQFRHLDPLISNPDAPKRAKFLAITEEDLRTLRAEIHGDVRMTSPARPHLRESKGSIVNTLGLVRVQGPPRLPPADRSLTKPVADIGAGLSVPVNATSPEVIEPGSYSQGKDIAQSEERKKLGSSSSKATACTRLNRSGCPSSSACCWATSRPEHLSTA
jgi:NAD(P)-dependent dehydrogenase (short-subunit alcohol dehydrogenase family)